MRVVHRSLISQQSPMAIAITPVGAMAMDGGYSSSCSPSSVGVVMADSAATDAAIQRGFDNQSVMNKLNGLEQGLCNGFYGVNTTLLQGFNSLGNTFQQGNFGLQQAINDVNVANMQNTNALQAQLQNCCGENREAIAQVRYDMATNTCAINNTIQNATRDVIDNQNANYRAIHDELVASQIEAKNEKIAEQQSLIQSLSLAQSQANQNQYLINQLRPCPTPAYITCNPWASNGTAYNGCQNVCG